MNTEIIVALTSLATAVLTTTMGPIIQEWSKVVFKKPKPDPITQALNVSLKVGDKIEEIKQHLNADKVIICQFHNGGTFYPTGKSIQKFSIFYESSSTDLTNIKMFYKDMPVHLFHKLLDSVKNNGFVSIEDFDNPLIPTYNLETINESLKCKSMYVFGIYNMDNKFIGMLKMFFKNNNRVLSPSEINKVLQDTGVIGGFIMNHLQN